MSTWSTRLLRRALGVPLLALGMTAGAQQPPEQVAEPQEQLREEVPVADGRFIRLATPVQALTVQVTPDFIIGPDLRLVQSDDNVTGRAYGRSVFISMEPGEDDMEGLIGTLPAWFTFGREQDVLLRMEGIMGGGPVQLTVTPEELTGTVGMCTYDLEFQQDAGLYEGTRVCAGTPWQPVSLGVSPELLEQVDPMTVMALAVLLGG